MLETVAHVNFQVFQLRRATYLTKLILRSSSGRPAALSSEVARSTSSSGYGTMRIWPALADSWTTGFPRLTEVQLAYNDAESTALRGPRTILDSAPDIVPPERWEAEGVTGYILREYVRSEFDEVGQFWHVRMLRADAQDIDDGTVPELMLRGVGNSRSTAAGEQRTKRGSPGHRRWVECTLFQGRTVPAEVVAAVYAIGGLSMDWFKGGRRWTLKKESWAVLDAYLKEAGGPTGLR